MPFDVIDWLIRRLDQQAEEIKCLKAFQDTQKKLARRVIEGTVIFAILAVNLGMEKAAKLTGDLIKALF